MARPVCKVFFSSSSVQSASTYLVSGSVPGQDGVRAPASLFLMPPQIGSLVLS